uniref:Uncharacterized protein n=1 Tax=Anguilla anguilla TaxID=7936 RepID=A0A0E9SDU7_ANGAN
MLNSICFAVAKQDLTSSCQMKI